MNTNKQSKVSVLITGPSLNIVSGVSTHIHLLLDSNILDTVNLFHFDVGSEGKKETKLNKVQRYICSPVRLAIEIIRTNSKVVHINTSLDIKAFWRDLIYVYVAKILGAKIVYQVHGGAIADFVGNSRILKKLVGRVLRVPDVIVVLSSTELNNYRQYARIQEIRLIPNAIKLSHFNVKTKLQEPRDVHMLNFVYVGRLAHNKGIFEAIDALAILMRRGFSNKFNFLIAGGGASESALKRKVVDLGLQDVVCFVGAIFGQDKINFWNAADLFIFPTYHKEGLPYSILESIASGTPVISTRIGGITDVIREGVEGVFVEPHDPVSVADAIQSLCSDVEVMTEMRNACVKRANEFYGLERMANQFGDIYKYLNNKI